MQTQSRQLECYVLTTAQAADYLEVSVGHLHNLLSAGCGPRHVKYGGQLRFRPADLETWVAARCRPRDA